jgi:hypothetical protein
MSKTTALFSNKLLKSCGSDLVLKGFKLNRQSQSRESFEFLGALMSIDISDGSDDIWVSKA